MATRRLNQSDSGAIVPSRSPLRTALPGDEESLEAFREEYAEMPIYEKAMENKWLVGGSAVTTLLLLIGLPVINGIL